VIKKLTSLQLLYLNIHTAKKYFKKVGSSFTWYLIKNAPGKRNFIVEGIRKGITYKSKVKSEVRKYIPLVYNDIIQSILHKTLDDGLLSKFKVETSSDLHKYTKKHLISTEQDDDHPYRLIHTPKQTVYASRPHKYQEGYKVFISTTSYYNVFVDNCGMTQNVAFIRCDDEVSAFKIRDILMHPLYKFLNNICRWGNFNNPRILQSFPMCDDVESVWKHFGISEKGKDYVLNFI
jgi:adenine-specific DNA-methyltransferase